MKTILAIPLSILILCLLPDASITYSKKSSHIVVHPAQNKYTETVVLQGHCPAGHQEVVNIYYGELDEIKHLDIRYKNKKGKWRSLSKKEISSSSAMTSSFYAGVRKYSFMLEAQDRAFPFEVTYQKTTKDLMFLASLSFDDDDGKVDTFQYHIDIPDGYSLQYKIDQSDEAEGLIDIEQRTGDGKTIYQFSSVGAQRVKEAVRFAPSIRIITHSVDSEAFDYFNDWYYQLVLPHSRLSAKTIAAIEASVEGLEEDEAKIKAVFQLVQKKISYISFESGIGAVRPRDVNEIFQYKQGDCKDMGNLLCQSLRHLGYEAYMAISSTLSHRVDLDFPSLASANHAICVVKLNDEWIYLDATESHGLYGYPSRHIQDRNIFIVDEGKGQLHKIEKVSKEKNKAEYRFHLKQNGNTISGQFDLHLKGLSQLDYINIQNYSSGNTVEEILKNYTETMSNNLDVQDIQLTTHSDSSHLTSKVQTSKNFTSIKQKTYLSLAFLMQPRLTKEPLMEDDELITYQTVNNHYEVLIDLEDEIRLKPFTTVDFEEEGIQFKFEVQQSQPNQIKIIYNYNNEHLQIKEELIKSYNAARQLIRETLQKSIIYDTKT